MKSFGHTWGLSLDGTAFGINAVQDTNPIEAQIVSLTNKQLVLEKRLINGDLYVHTYEIKSP